MAKETIGCQTYGEYLEALTGPLASAWGASHPTASLQAAYVENDLFGGTE